MNAVITGKRQREVGLVVSAKYSFETDNKKCAEILEKELVKRKELFPTVALKLKKKDCTENFPCTMNNFNISFDYMVSLCCLTVKKKMIRFYAVPYLILPFPIFLNKCPFSRRGCSFEEGV